MGDQTMSPGCAAAMGIFLIIGGFMALVAPFQSSMAFAVAIGWLLAIGGLVRIVWGFFRIKEGWKYAIWDWVVGAIYLLVGATLVPGGDKQPGDVIMATYTLTWVLGFLLLFQGILELVAAFMSRPAPEWKWLSVGGVLGILLGLLIIMGLPQSAFWALGIYIGIMLIFAGFRMFTFRNAASSGPPAAAA